MSQVVSEPAKCTGVGYSRGTIADFGTIGEPQGGHGQGFRLLALHLRDCRATGKIEPLQQLEQRLAQARLLAAHLALCSAVQLVVVVLV